MAAPIEVIQTTIEILTHDLSAAHINKKKNFFKKFDKKRGGGVPLSIFLPSFLILECMPLRPLLMPSNESSS